MIEPMMTETTETPEATEDRLPRTWVIDLPGPAIVTGRCSHRMTGKKRHRVGTKAPRWTQRCPNRATVIRHGRHYCDVHRPAATTRGD